MRARLAVGAVIARAYTGHGHVSGLSERIARSPKEDGKMEKHLTFVGALHIGYNALGVLAAMVVFLLVVGGGLIGGLVSDEEIVIPITFFVGTAIAMWLVVLSVPGIIGGIGVLRRHSWARYLLLVLSILYLFNVPIGTAIGAYSIWALAQDEAAQLFGSKSG
jgi:hypothetical protein